MSYLKKLGGGVPNQKIKRIPNAVNERYFEGDVQKGDGILFLERLHPVKDIRTLTNGIKESRRYNQATLVGDGDDSYKADIDFWERAQRVILLRKGPVYDIEKKIKIIDEHEIFVLPSLMEAMPISLIEAMARGKIVVATRTEGAKELIKDEVNGFLVDIGDPDEMGEIFDRIYEMTELEKKKIREAARKSAEEYKMEKIMERWESVFNK
jgi:glycosyltransferase involved in cell wall biosynthesis